MTFSKINGSLQDYIYFYIHAFVCLKKNHWGTEVDFGRVKKKHVRLGYCLQTDHSLQGKKDMCLMKNGSDGKASVCNAGDPGSIPGLGRSPGEGNASPLQYSCLENPMDREAW